MNYNGDEISDYEWAAAEDDLWERNIDNEDYCHYYGCELELSFLGMKCPNPNCEFDEVEF